jgi:hypothetical protein
MNSYSPVQVTIEHNIPMPLTTASNRNNYKRIFKQMNTGDSFLVKNTQLNGVLRAATNYKVTVVYRPTKSGSSMVRVWKQ